jgi:hypothetical protein
VAAQTPAAPTTDVLKKSRLLRCDRSHMLTYLLKTQ